VWNLSFAFFFSSTPKLADDGGDARSLSWTDDVAPRTARAIKEWFG
jgi:hypothetical protein